MNAIEWQANQIEMAGNMLAHFVSTTEPDKLNWVPKAEGYDSKARSIFEYVGECIAVNNRTASRIRGEDPGEFKEVELNDSETAQRLVRESAKNFADAVRGCDESFLEKKFQMPFGEWTGQMLISIPNANMHYHIGQINYTQNLYGDDVFHVPTPN